MKISSTSALVLNWTDMNLYQGEKVKSFISNLDLSEGDALMIALDADQHYMHTRAVSARKFYMSTTASMFLEQCEKENIEGQVLIMAAGISPLSIALAERFPTASVFDLDLYLMEEKKEMLKDEIPNISFIKCNLDDIEFWNTELIKNKFDSKKKTIAIFEGIVYYLKQDSLLNMFKWCSSNNVQILGDYCIHPDEIDIHYQKYPDQVFSVIQKKLNLPPIVFYNDLEFAELLTKSGYKDFEIETLPDIHLKRTGEIKPFAIENSGWIAFWKSK